MAFLTLFYFVFHNIDPPNLPTPLVSTSTPLHSSTVEPRSAQLTRRTPLPQHDTAWLDTFQVPWERMTQGLKNAIEKSEVPDETDRRHMVRTIVDAIQEVSPNPTRSQCEVIAKSIVQKYPDSFTDKNEEGEKIGVGYFSLLEQIKRRVEHVNRSNSLVRLRTPTRRLQVDPDDQNTPALATAPPLSKCAKTDSYGCVSWQPEDLPEGETSHSLEEKRKEMVDIFSQEGSRAEQNPRVEELMTITYVKQRHAINANPPLSVTELQEQWPFLLSGRFLTAHFTTLTGVPLATRMTEALNQKGPKLLHYFRSQLTKWKKEVKTTLKDIEVEGREDAQGLAALLVMMAFFQEKEDAVFLLADVSDVLKH